MSRNIRRALAIAGLAAKFVAVTFRQEERMVPGKPGAAASPAGTPPPLKPRGAGAGAGSGADRLERGM